MRLRIGHLSTVYHTALLLRGLKALERKGMDVTWELFGGGPAIVEAMKRGKIDIGYIGLPPTMIGMADGAEIKCVAGGHIEGTALTTIKKGPEEWEEKRVIHDLRGERIGSPPKGSIHDIIIRHLLKKNGVKARVVNYPWADFIPLAIERGEITAAVGTPALAIYLKQNLGARIALPPEMIWPYNPSYGIIAQTDLIDTKELKTFIELHEEMSNHIIKSPQKAAETVAGFVGMIEPEFVHEVIKLSPHYCAALPPEYIQSTLDFVPVMQEHGYLTKNLTKKDIFHTSLIEEVHTEGNHYSSALKL
jgi:NitT/TauT family transport system substrate-binding protein